MQQLAAEWSPAGEAIIYSVTGEPQPGRVVRRELASGEDRLLYQDSLLIMSLLELAPNGRHAVVSVEDTLNASEDGAIAILDLETGATRQIFASNDSVSYLGWTSVGWTPDGEYVMYALPIGGDEHRTHVWRVAAAGGDPEYLWTVGEGKYHSWFELSPDGRQIAVTTYTQETEIWVMDNLKEVLERDPLAARNKFERSR